MDPDLQTKLNRIRGQVEGISRMIEEGRDCMDVVQQILAARNALSKVGKEYLTKEAVQCSTSKNKEKMDDILKQLFAIS